MHFTVLVSLLIAGAHTGRCFGTVNRVPFLGQNSEHERITRAALACQDVKSPECFEPNSIDQLAGTGFTFGAVGGPDEPRFPNPFAVEGPLAHCDDADFLDIPGYPTSRNSSTAMLQGCVSHLRNRVTQGVAAASSILTDKDLIRKDEVELGSCDFQGDPDDNAKCKALQGFGRALHGIQDFYSHSNWADRAGPNAIDAINPPGLYRPNSAGFFDLRSNQRLVIQANSPFYNLSTGCYGGFHHDRTPGVGDCFNRITHNTLNKDDGIIDPVSGATSNPSTARGQVLSNFHDAVTAAIIDTRRQWRHFRYALQDKYGSLRANRIACSMTTDDPVKDCQGRKIGIVVDSSSSNTETDPGNLRISAAFAFNHQLISVAEAEAGSDGRSDLVTVIDFDDSARVIYPLGDPAGAATVFSNIDSYGGTFIAGGLSAAIDEIDTGTTVPTRGKLGIVVLTDGQDSNVGLLIAQIGRAIQLGIRVSFGFLSPLPVPIRRLNRRQSKGQDPDLLQAIIGSGGTYSVITSAEAQQAFIDLVVGRGVTELDNGLGLSILKPGLAVAEKISSTDGAQYFLYKAAALLSLNITITTINSVAAGVLTATLHDIDRNIDITTVVTDASGSAIISVSTACDRSLELTIMASDASNIGHLYSVELQTSNTTTGSDTASCDLTEAPPAPANPDRLIYLDNTTTTSSSSTFSTTSSPTFLEETTSSTSSSTTSSTSFSTISSTTFLEATTSSTASSITSFLSRTAAPYGSTTASTPAALSASSSLSLWNTSLSTHGIATSTSVSRSTSRSFWQTSSLPYSSESYWIPDHSNTGDGFGVSSQPTWAAPVVTRTYVTDCHFSVSKETAGSIVWSDSSTLSTVTETVTQTRQCAQCTWDAPLLVPGVSYLTSDAATPPSSVSHGHPAQQNSQTAYDAWTGDYHDQPSNPAGTNGVPISGGNDADPTFPVVALSYDAPESTAAPPGASESTWVSFVAPAQTETASYTNGGLDPAVAPGSSGGVSTAVPNPILTASPTSSVVAGSTDYEHHSSVPSGTKVDPALFTGAAPPPEFALSLTIAGGFAVLFLLIG